MKNVQTAEERTMSKLTVADRTAEERSISKLTVADQEEVGVLKKRIRALH